MMDNKACYQQDDFSASNSKNESNLQETIKNPEERQDQNLANSPPQALMMDNKACHQQDDFSASNSKNDSNLHVTIKNPEERRDQNLVNSPPQGRVRLYSESQVYTVSRWQDVEPQDGASAEENGGAADGPPFRGRSQSAPAALWKAKKYGRQLRRMSDEFDTWLDRGEVKRASSHGRRAQKQTYRGWFSFLWSPKEEEGRE